MFQPSKTTPYTVEVKARTVLLDWYHLDGSFIAASHYLSTAQSLEAICQEIDQFARKGKRLGSPDPKVNRRSEFVCIKVLSEGVAHLDGATPRMIPLDPGFEPYLHVVTIDR